MPSRFVRLQQIDEYFLSSQALPRFYKAKLVLVLCEIDSEANRNTFRPYLADINSVERDSHDGFGKVVAGVYLGSIEGVCISIAVNETDYVMSGLSTMVALKVTGRFVDLECQFGHLVFVLPFHRIGLFIVGLSLV